MAQTMSDPYSDEQDLLRTVKFDRVVKPTSQPQGALTPEESQKRLQQAYQEGAVDLQQTMAFKGVMKIPPGGGKPRLVIPGEGEAPAPPAQTPTSQSIPEKAESKSGSRARSRAQGSATRGKSKNARRRTTNAKAEAKSASNTRPKSQRRSNVDSVVDVSEPEEAGQGISPLWVGVIVFLCLLIGFLTTVIIVLLLDNG